MSFLYHGARRKNPELPNLGPDLKPRELKHSKEATREAPRRIRRACEGADRRAADELRQDRLALVRRQAGDSGRRQGHHDRADPRASAGHRGQPAPAPAAATTSRSSDSSTTDKVQDGWAEFCNTWASNWSYVEQPMRHNGFVLGQLAQGRSLGDQLPARASARWPTATFRRKPTRT